MENQTFRVSEPKERRNEWIKPGLIVILVAASASIAGVFVIQGTFFQTLIALFIFWSLFTIQVLALRDLRVALIAVFADAFFMALPIALVFREFLSLYLFAAWAVFLAFLTYTIFRSWKVLEGSVKIPFRRVIKGIVINAVAGTLIFLSVTYFAAGKIGEAAPLLTGLGTDVTPRNIIEGAIIKNIPEEERAGFDINSAVSQVKENLEGYFGEFNLDMPIWEVIVERMSSWFEAFELAGKTLGFILILLVLWLVFRGIGYLFYIPLSLIVFLIYEVLIVSNFLVIKFESRSVERIVLK
ncbi:MAG: hypothetical protein HYS87_03365 [Candidatus Colwellbacteria bacterium]|nr:hypothetical protein [Candidatus Colwellbacteria bacterium]